MKITLKDGESFEARTSLGIVDKMKGASMFTEFKTAEAYIEMVVRNAWRFFGVGLEVSGKTEGERARALIKELVSKGLARKERE
jgi:hypothetical protein